MKLAILLIGLLSVVLVGCSAGDVSLDEVKKNQKAQADWIKAHPAPPDTHIE